MFDLGELLENLNVEQIGAYAFRGDSLPLSLPHVFGGQLVAQALSAAAKTVDSDSLVNSLHAYFIRPGDPNQPITYAVDPIRDGTRFSARRVVAEQSGKTIFHCSVSFHREEPGVSHRMAMPTGIPEPETLQSNVVRLAENPPSISGPKQPFELPLKAVDVRAVYTKNFYSLETDEPVQGYWFQFCGDLGNDQNTHRILLAYISDKELMLTSLRPHGMNMLSADITLSSLDHAVWIHSNCRVDDWLYYHMDSPCAAGGRSFGRGSIYTREGVLVASCAQEGLVRLGEQ
ncbi:MAG: acyl-CoA thioesterase II [Oceanospirillaceae bacterium]|nr:acyl-CoA thioesterase II [Oceanospirillaceae bacterium]|tara:strand:+ start:88 stop:951 length:864 start_codon:yes stop_codon:yes gene_type:complete